jgi:hypothetical protein
VPEQYLCYPTRSDDENKNPDCRHAGIICRWQAAEKPLKILLVNDDGCLSVGTTSLRDKLAAKGYDVWMVAPTTNQSGISSAITFKTGRFCCEKSC